MNILSLDILFFVIEWNSSGVILMLKNYKDKVIKKQKNIDEEIDDSNVKERCYFS